MKKIIVACGSGVATSQAVASKIDRMLKERKIKATVEAVDIKSLSTHIKQCDVYVSITPDKNKYTVPVINGISFLTGIGVDKEFEKLISYLN